MYEKWPVGAIRLQLDAESLVNSQTLNMKSKYVVGIKGTKKSLLDVYRIYF